MTTSEQQLPQAPRGRGPRIFDVLNDRLINHTPTPQEIQELQGVKRTSYGTAAVGTAGLGYLAHRMSRRWTTVPRVALIGSGLFFGFHSGFTLGAAYCVVRMLKDPNSGIGSVIREAIKEASREERDARAVIILDQAGNGASGTGADPVWTVDKKEPDHRDTKRLAGPPLPPLPASTPPPAARSAPAGNKPQIPEWVKEQPIPGAETGAPKRTNQYGDPIE
ncbi:hypothetical protein HK101_007077 [Irineochytrium annulatum]|nr:hypothetical protein HK101_007077 [Irineochytrium annulatum]